MRTVTRILCFGLISSCFALGMPPSAQAQYPIAVAPAPVVVPVQTIAPAVLGYTVERRGLFGWRSVYRPIVAPAVATTYAPAPMVVARPAVTAPVVVARPAVTAPVVAAPVVVARPIMPAPVVVGYPPPVTSYYAPRVVAPVTTLRVPVIQTYAPVYGF